MNEIEQPYSEIFPKFKANQGLSYSDITKIFNCTLDEARHWTQGYAPSHINQCALACNIIIERWKSENGAVNDVDRQHHMHEAQKLQEENDRLNLIINDAFDILNQANKSSQLVNAAEYIKGHNLNPRKEYEDSEDLVAFGLTSLRSDGDES